MLTLEKPTTRPTRYGAEMREVAELDEHTLCRLRENAALVVKQAGTLTDFAFGYTPESLEWLDGFIERLRAGGMFDGTGGIDGYLNVFGSYLGEAVIHAVGGTWKRCDGDLGVTLPEGNWAFPFAKVEKLLRGEDGQSLRGFYEAALALPQFAQDKKEQE